MPFDLQQLFRSLLLLPGETAVLLSLFTSLAIMCFRSESAQSRPQRLLQYLFLVLGASICLINAPESPTQLFGYLSVSAATNCAKAVAILATLMSSFLRACHDKNESTNLTGGNSPDISLLTTLSLLGILVTISANNFLIAYLSIELFTLPLYVLAAISYKQHRLSLEASVKYFTFSVFSSLILLFGISLVGLHTGTLEFPALENLLADTVSDGTSRICALGFALLYVGLFFKLGAAPLHFWVTDVYSGVVNPTLSFYAVAPKVASAYLLYKVHNDVLSPVYANNLGHLLWFFSALSLLIGSVGAIRQTNFKRLLAYSSIMNSGFILMAVSGSPGIGLYGLIIYFFAYSLAFNGLIALSMRIWPDENAYDSSQIAALSGLAKIRPALALGSSALLFSIAGIPPFVGFSSKLYIFIASYSVGSTYLLIVAIATSVVSLVYYLRIIGNFYFNKLNPELRNHAHLPAGSGLEVFNCLAAIISVVSIAFLGYLQDLLG